MYTIVKGRKVLGFDSTGHHEWKDDRLDAIRFDSEQHAYECCHTYIDQGAKVERVDEWDGHYEAFKGYEVQVFRDEHRDIPGGKRWRFRFGEIAHGRPYEYTPGNIGYTSPEAALQAAEQAVNDRIRNS